ncbi:MAG: type II secretion system ATPase GspE [Spirochaetes bacterium]|nr:type II secretion system ATPase GspE [Spirochaetota bacterium]
MDLSGKKLGEIIVIRNMLTEKDILSALKIKKESGLRLGETLLQKGLITEDNLYLCLAEQSGLDYESKPEFTLKKDFLERIPVKFFNRNLIVPFKTAGKKLYVAITDPLDVLPVDDIRNFFSEYKIVTVLSTADEVRKIIFENIRRPEDSSADGLDNLNPNDFDLLTNTFDETEDILDMANEAPIIKFVNTIITESVTENASDIHIEPYEKNLIIRFRIDGILYQRFDPPKKLQSAIISRIKIMSNLNIAENRLPQDGRIQLKIGKKDIDIRVSVFPTHFGERIVLRILNKSDMSFDLSNLGLSREIMQRFEKVISIPHGITMVTGPTGSGKSTTLYAVLNKIYSPEINILTVEDPIEYQLNGIGQMQVKPKIDLTFAAGLRSILRQDPDVIMVGEIRDVETAEIAVQSALTGHSVFSTIHTNDAASAITRLLDMGVEPFLIASSVNSFIAQRLVRKICPHCKKAYKPAPSLLKELGVKSADSKNLKFYEGKGCEKCFNTGYQGRTGIYELLVVSNSIKKLIIDKSDSDAIKKQAVLEGMVTLLQDGITKAANGITSIDEILRVTV